MAFYSVAETLSSSRIKPNETPLQQHHDQSNDVVMCNNYIGGRLTKGYIIPKPLSETTQLMLPKNPKSAKLRKKKPIIRQWANQATLELDFCCLEATAYTHVWDTIINRCIKDDNITPCVYHMSYVIMKAMARTPRIPPGTVLYRGSKVPFSKYEDNMCFMSFTINKTVAERFGWLGYIGSYTVKPTDYIHGLWFNNSYGTSTFPEREILLGPGIIVSVSGEEDNMGIYPLELEQKSFGSYFMDNYRPDGDENFRKIVETGCIVAPTKKSIFCLIDDRCEKILQSEYEEDYLPRITPIEDLDKVEISFFYNLVQTGRIMAITVPDTVVTEPIDIRIDEEIQHRCVYKVFSNRDDNDMYCTLRGMCYLAKEGYDLEVLPLEDIDSGTLVIDSNPRLEEIVDAYVA